MGDVNKRWGLAMACSLAVASCAAMDIVAYTPEGLLKRQQAGEAVSLSFFAKWCATCLMQERVFRTFQGDASVPGTLLVVDYDQSHQIMQRLHVHAQSTLIVYKGHAERHRSGGLTDPRALKQALQSAR